MIAPRHPRRPKMRRRDHLSALIIVVSLTLTAWPVVSAVMVVLRAPCLVDLVSGCVDPAQDPQGVKSKLE